MSKAIQVVVTIEVEVPDDTDRNNAGPHLEKVYSLITAGLHDVGLEWDLVNTYLVTEDDYEELE